VVAQSGVPVAKLPNVMSKNYISDELFHFVGWNHPDESKKNIKSSAKF